MKTLILIILIASFTVKAELIETHFRYLDTNDTKFILGKLHTLECFNKHKNYAFIFDREDGSITSESFKRIYKSEDYGKTWHIASSINPYDDLDLFNRSCATVTKSGNFFIGYRAKKGFLSTIKNGKNEKINLEIDLSVEDIKMFDDSIGVALLRNDFIFEQKLLITKDGWQTWQEVDNIYDLENNIFGIQSLNFKNKDTLAFTIFIEGNPNIMFLDVNTLEKKYYLITDEMFGDLEYISFISDIDLVNDSLMFCAGLLKNGDGNRGYDNIFKSTDGGKTWNKIFSEINENPEGLSLGLQRISFFNEKNGIAVGAPYSILYSNDGGETWEYQQTHPNMLNTSEFYVEWSNRTPIFATDFGGLYRYEGNFFDFSGLQNKFKLSGKVLTEEGEPVPNVPVLIHIHIPHSTPLDTIFTDQEGYYESPELPEMELTIELPRDSFYKKYDEFWYRLYMDKDTTINFIQIVPKNTYKISGLTYENEVAIAGMHLLVKNTNFGDTIIQSDDNGYFEIDAPEGEVVLKSPYFINSGHIYYNGLYRTSSKFNLQNDTANVEIEINSKSNILNRVSGKVILNGEPFENAKIITDLISNIPNISYSNINGNYYTAFFDNLFEKVTIKVDSVIDGVTYNVIPKEYVVKRDDFNNNLVDFDFELSPISSVESSELTPLIYPNPAIESITISGIGQGKIEIYNTLGQKLIEKEIFGTSTINTSTLQTGMYVIKLESGGEVVFEKVIINR